MQITTLGPLAVDGRPVRGERLVTLVRELVDARGRLVSTPALVEAIWDGAPPIDAAGAVQALVSRIRRLGLPVVAVAGGYRIPAEEVSVDAVDARTLVERARGALRSGDPADARRWADAARALFPEVPELDGTERTRLLADVAAVRAQAALAGAGGFDETDLRRLAGHAPPDEPSAALLVRTLAAQGRTAEAMEVVEQLRTELADRYGTDPSPVVTEAYLALLRGELQPKAAETRPSSGVPSPTTTLPVAWRRPATPLVGRDRDLAAVTAALGDGTPDEGRASLVTVVATGGAGKTRLAVEVARHAASAGQPVHVVELAGLRSPDEVLPAVLAAIGAADTAPGRVEFGPDRRVLNTADRLQAAARDLEGLIVLDNCEHVLAAAATVVADLLAAAPPEVSVLATSRAPLSLAGEVVYRLRALPDDDALALLNARVRAGGAPLAGDAERALELCHRLDNLPLALELAAARLRHMPIDDVLAGLADRFALLDDALRGLPERHASLWAMVDWSRELLPPEDRDLLQRLAVIPAPFTADAAARVAGERATFAAPPTPHLRRGPHPERPDVRRGLATLVEQSLLFLGEGDDGRPRYRMLETVREYGEVRLDAAGDRASAMAGLVDWARAKTIALFPEFAGPQQVAAFTRCAADGDNLVAALRWSIAHEEEAAAVDIAVTLFHMWTVRGLHVEVVSWARQLLYVDDPLARRRSAIQHGTASGRPLPDADRLAWTCLAVGLNGLVGDTHRVYVLALRAVRTLFAQRRDEISARAAALAGVLPALASPDTDVGLEAAGRLIADADPYVQGFGFLLRAALRENRGMPAAAADDAEQAYRWFEAAGNQWGMGLTAQGLGEWYTSRGQKGGDEWLRRGEQHLRLIGATQDVGSVRVLLDVQAALAGDDEAAERLREASTSAELKEMDAAQANLGLAMLEWQQGRPDGALAHAEIAIETADRMAAGIPQIRAIFRVASAVLHLRVAAAQPSETAEAHAVELLAVAGPDAISSMDIPVLGSWALGGAALAAYHGDRQRARDLWAAGMRLGANLVNLFQPGQDERLASALGTEHERDARLAEWRERSVAETTDRIREAMDEMLA